MNRSTTLARAVGCAALLVVLAGCSPSPGNGPSAATPTATATAEAPEQPTSRVAIECDELVPLEVVSAAAGEEVAAVDPVPESDQASLAEFAAEQYGQLDCAWSVGPLGYNAVLPVVTASVVPEVPASYWDEYTAQLGETATAQDTFPGDAYTTCVTADEASGCRLDALIDGYWLAVQVSTEGAEVDIESVTSAFMAAATSVASTGDAPEAWPAYVGGPRPEGVLDEPAVAAALGATVERTGCGRPAGQEEHTVAFAETGYGSCTYEILGLPDGQSAFVSVDVLPGGSWALEPLREVFTGAVTPLPEAGPDAYTTPYGADTTSAVLLRDDDLMLVSIRPSDTVELTPATITAIATAIA
jgi:hypothetical protein